MKEAASSIPWHSAFFQAVKLEGIYIAGKT
jgi:hypothetical protein